MSQAAAPHYQFVTGRLAEPALRDVVERLAEQRGFTYTIDVMPITVAALMSPAWIAPRLQVRPGVTHVMLPGYCEGDLAPLEEACPVPLVIGPRDLHALPDYFGQADSRRAAYGGYAIEIIAEINHAPRLPLATILDEAQRLARDGADVIDVGCQPGETWRDVGSCVQALRDAGHRVSIDSMNVAEIEWAVRAGAELVLSVNRQNRDAAADWGCEVVAIPDEPSDMASLETTIDSLVRRGVPLRIDPILEPIGFEMGASLLRYARVRERYPELPMMMGIGNLTELTDVDSAGLNVLLLALCEEWRIHSVLTTQVINWSRTSVRECDLARRLVHYAIGQRTLPKHVEPALVTLRDPQIYELGPERLEQLADSIRDHNYRIFAEGGELHLVAADLHLHDADPFVLFRRLLATSPKNIDASHAFYLGYELSKARTALTLSKQYRQDEALDWGYLTVPEAHHPPGPRKRDRSSGP